MYIYKSVSISVDFRTKLENSYMRYIKYNEFQNESDYQ